MNKNLIKMTFLLVLTAILFTACMNKDISTIENEILNYSDGSNLTEAEFYYKSQAECEVVLFNCPQGEYPFINGDGCGCGIPTDDSVVSADQRSLKALVKNYISHKVFPQEVGTIYETISETIFLTADKEYFDNYVLTDYEMWVELEQYEILDGKVILLNKYSGPIEFELKEFGLNYAIEGHNIYPDMEPEVLAENFQANSLTWILDQDPDRPSVEIKKQMQDRLASQVESYIALVQAILESAESDEEVSVDQVTDLEAEESAE